MAIFSGPEIPNNGLVFHYDIVNTKKSWKGEPTTNLVPNMDIVAVQGSPTIAFVGIEDGWRKYSINGTWSSGTYPYSVAATPVSLVGGTTYSTSMFVKTNVPNKFATLFSGMNYVNQPMNNVGTSFSVPQADGSFYVGRTGFQYTSSTSQAGYLLSQPIIGQSFSSASDFIFIRNGQVEAKSYPTPFVNGTRSNTQALVDLTGNNTITATSLTYASDNTFSFNGTSNSLSVPFNASRFTFNSEQTIIIWMKNQTSSALRRNPYNMAYGGGGTITHEINNTFNYYYGTSGSDNVPYTAHTSTFSVIVGETAMIAITRNPTQISWYKNGALGNTVANPYGATVVTGTSDITIGDGYVNPFEGSLYAIQIYNRALSETEVYQNFEATRTRYGI